MVVDFCEAESALKTVVSQWHHRHLNDHPAFEKAPPTAEIVAQRVFSALRGMDFPQIHRVEVVEAPACVAEFRE